VDAQGLPVFGRGTVSWGFRADIEPKVKLLRSTKGFATSHQDNFSTVIAATDYPINLSAATVDGYGWTVVATTEPHFLKSGDVVTFSGVPVPTVDSTNTALTTWDGTPLVYGSWVVSVILGPTAFGLRQNPKPLPVGTTAMLVSAAGLTGLPFDVSGFSTYTPVCGAIATPSLTRIPLGQDWVTDQSVVPGVEYYYSLWVADWTVPGLWVFGDQASFLAPRDHNSIARFFDVLPPFLTNVNYGSSELPLIDVLSDTDSLTPGAPTTGKFLAGLAWQWDNILTHVDKVQRLWDASSMPSALLPSAVATFGLPDEPTFGMRSRRALVQSAQYLSSSRGTRGGLEVFVESLVGLPTTVTLGQNLLLGTDCSSFTYGTGSWAATNAALTLDPSNTYAIPKTYFVTNAATTTPGLLDIPQSLKVAATGSAVLSLAGGVVNVALTVVSTSLQVDTVLTHGLEVGDWVSVTGAAPSGYNVTAQVTGVPTPTRYTLLPPVLPTGIVTAPGSSQSAATHANPFALSQGVPVTAALPYTLSLYIASSVASTVSAAVSWWDAQGRLIGSPVTAVTSQATTTSVAQVVGAPVTSPARAAYLTCDLTLGAVTHYLDAVMLTQGGTATFQDARTVYVAMAASSASLAASSSTLNEVVRSRLVANLQNQLPVGTAFVLSINGTLL
jgi:phage tail-like protein